MISEQEIREQLSDGTMIAIRSVGRELQALTTDGRDVTNMIRRWTRKKALDTKSGLMCRHTKNGGVQWRQVPEDQVNKLMTAALPTSPSAPSVVHASAAILKMTPKSESSWVPLTDEQVKETVVKAMTFKPDSLEIEEVLWRYMIRSAVRGENVLIVGPSGCGKTVAGQSLAGAFPGRAFATFNFGASQDPRGMLIGNTHYDKASGTFFSESYFCQMIQTPGAIIQLDELSRAHDDAANIIMTVLDKKQRYLRIDERPDTPTIVVAPGVTFIATANVGNEYTGTRVMDRALLDRFSVIIEMQPLSKEKEEAFLKKQFPTVPEKAIQAIAKIADHTRQQVKSEDPKVSTIISTRLTLDMAGLLKDGFTLKEAAQVCIYPFYPNVGGVDSERTYMMQLVQKEIPTEFDDKDKPWDPNQSADPKKPNNKIPW